MERLTQAVWPGDPMAAALGLSLAAVLLLLCAVTVWRDARGRLRRAEAEHARVVESLRCDLARERDAVAEATERIESWIAARTAAETRLEEVESRLEVVVGERDRALAQRDLALEEASAAERAAALRDQQMAAVERRLADWETTRAESLQAARAAVLSVAGEVSSKLLEDHKRETAEAKKDAEERLRQTTTELLTRMQAVTSSVAALDRQVEATRTRTETVWAALSSPGGAGRFAEIGLENTLAGFGLVKGRDFLVQSRVDGAGLRPDAIVLLPGDCVLVIDSKASKYLLELAAAADGPAQEEARRGLARTMNQHLRGLADKNYRAEIAAQCRRAGRSGDIQRIVSVMYLPNEGAVERLIQADPEFRDKARRVEILLAGPEALGCLVAFASVQIDFVRRIDNQEQIVQGTRALIDCLGVVLEHTEKLGRGVQAAADGYVQLTRSINGTLLPKVRGLVDKGVRPTRSRPLPTRLPSHQLVALDAPSTIDGEATAMPMALPETAAE